MHLHITGSVTLSQIFVRGVRGSTDSLVKSCTNRYLVNWPRQYDLALLTFFDGKKCLKIEDSVQNYSVQLKLPGTIQYRKLI